MQAILVASLYSCKVQSSTRARHHYFLRYDPIPSFCFTRFIGFYLSKLLFGFMIDLV
jgi:hypothetical protein